MKILAQENEESVLCIMPNGDAVEVTMLVVEGDEFTAQPNAQEAVNLLANNQTLLMSLKR
jgi:hypothetical protein